MAIWPTESYLLLIRSCLLKESDVTYQLNYNNISERQIRIISHFIDGLGNTLFVFCSVKSSNN